MFEWIAFVHTFLEKKEFLNLHRSQSILNEIWKFFFSQKGMYKRYPLKHFGTFIVFIDREMIEFWKQRLINRGNTILDSDCHKYSRPLGPHNMWKPINISRKGDGPELLGSQWLDLWK